MNYAGLKIKGKCFSELTSIKFFENTNSRAALVFGKNGSGKSTIAQGLKGISDNENLTEYETVELLKFNGDEIVILNDEEKLDIAKSIHVFNEDFILNKVHFQEDGLNTIVMLGETKELQEKIDEVNVKIQKTKEEIEKNKNFIVAANNSREKDSLSFTLNEIIKNLKRSWGNTKGELLGYKRSADVTEKTINELFDHYKHVDKKEYFLLDYKNQYSEKKLSYEKLKINIRLPTVTKVKVYLNEFKKVKSVIEHKIEKISLGDKENRISEILDQWNNEYLNDSQKVIKSNNTLDCPVCFQLLDNTYKKEINDILEMILGSEEVDKYKEILNSLVIPSVRINLEQYSILDNKELINKVNKAIECFELSRNELLNKIEIKKKNVFTEIEISTDFMIQNQYLSELIDQLNDEIGNFNTKIDEVDKLKNELIVLNDLICVIENESLYEIYVTKRSINMEIEKDLKKLSGKLVSLNIDLQNLISEMGSVQIACESINDNLMYIFYDENRLRLEHNNGKYTIKSRGTNIKLNSLSIGERNAVALSYFFSTIYNGKSNTNKFEEPMLLVIDDPISSFDHQNKIGIFSFLRLVLSEIHCENEQSKVVVMTHDLEVVHHFEKMYKDINEKHKIPFSKYRMENYKLTSLGQIKNDYSHFVQQVFKFADGDNSSSDSIGNMMRKLLEAFGSFNYRLGISQLSTDEKILGKIDDKYRKYFENSMYRLVLNGDSHMEERTQYLPIRDFYEFIDDSEKRRTARDLLVFLKLMDKAHLEKHLCINKEDVSPKILKIGQWQDTILTLVTV